MSLPELEDNYKALKANPIACFNINDEEKDEVIYWCKVKNASLKKSKVFAEMFQRDEDNRQAVLNLIEKQLFEKRAATALTETIFTDMVNPVFGTVEKTLKYMADQTEEAGFKHAIFERVKKTKGEKNPPGLNDEIAAMVKVFRGKGYFKKDYTFEEIFKAFGKYSHNEAGNTKTYNEGYFRDKNYYKTCLKQLQAIEIKNFSQTNKPV